MTSHNFGEPRSPGVRHLHLNDSDISPEGPALLVQAGTPEELGITVLKHFQHLRRWDLPLHLYAVVPLAHRASLPDSVAIYRVPVTSRHGDADEILLVPMKLHTADDYGRINYFAGFTADDTVSGYHAMAGLTLPTEAIGSVIVAEAYVAPDVAGDNRVGEQHQNARETRLAHVTGTAGTSLAQHVRRTHQPSTVGYASSAAKVIGPLMLFQFAGLPPQARPAGDTETAMPMSLLWSVFEEWLGELLLSAVSGAGTDLRLQTGDVRSLVAEATQAISSESAQQIAAALSGVDLRAVLRCSDDGPPLVLTDALLAWLTMPIAAALVELDPGAADLAQVETYYRQLVVLYDSVLFQSGELIAAGVPLDGELGGETPETVTRLLANRLSGLPPDTGLPAVLADAFDEEVLPNLGDNVDTLIATAVAVHQQVWTITATWVARRTGQEPGSDQL